MSRAFCLAFCATFAISGCSSRPALLPDASGADLDQGKPDASLADASVDAPKCVNTDKAKHRWAAIATHAWNGSIRPTDLALDGAGQLHVAGNFWGDATFGATTFKATSSTQQHYFFAKLSTSGSFLWVRAIPLTGGHSRLRITVDKTGQLWATGTHEGSITFGSTTLPAPVSKSAVFLVKLSAAGKILQALGSGGTGAATEGDLDLDASGDLYLTGLYRKGSLSWAGKALPAAGAGRLFVARIKPDGSLVWIQATDDSTGRFHGTGNPLVDALVDADDGAVIAGTFSGSVKLAGKTLVAQGSCGDFLNSDAFVMRVSPGGAVSWAVPIIASNACSEPISGVFATAGGGALVAGWFPSTGTIGAKTVGSTSTKDNHYVGAIAPSGQIRWVEVVSAGTGYDSAMADLASATLYLTGSFQKSASFGPTTLCSWGDRDLYVARLDLTKRAFTWAYSAGGSGPDYSNLITVDGAGQLYVVGNLGGDAVLGDRTFKSTFMPAFFWSLEPQ